MARATTTPTTTSQPVPAAKRPTIVFRRGAVTARAIPKGKGWHVEGDDPALVERIGAALRRPIRARVSREAIDEVDGAYQIESWVVELRPDDPRYPRRVARSLPQVGLNPTEFDDIEFVSSE